MTPEQFVYWLQGFNEIRDKNAVGLSEDQWEIVREHLQTVFHKVTPERDIIKSPDFVPNPYLYPPIPHAFPYTTGTQPPWSNPIITC